jgi:hypothetical protein
MWSQKIKSRWCAFRWWIVCLYSKNKVADARTCWLWKGRGGKSGRCVVSQDPRSKAPPRPVPRGPRLPPYGSSYPVPTGKCRLRSSGRIKGWGARPHSRHCRQWFPGVCVSLPPQSCPSSSHVRSLSLYREAHCRFSRGIVVVLRCEVLFQVPTALLWERGQLPSQLYWANFGLVGGTFYGVYVVEDCLLLCWACRGPSWDH